MSQILCYGGDALTYWAITSRLYDLLQALGDKSFPSAAVLMYHPSFGRRGSIGPQADKEQLNAEFGEFDAILGTQQAIYLVESKWDSSPRPVDYWITLKGVQSRRHAIMRWYLKTWRTSQPKDWPSFVAQQEASFQREFPGYRLAPAGSRLAQNLEFVQKTLGKCGENIQDVLLFIGQAGSRKPLGVKPDGFKLVTLEYKPVNPSGYFQIQNPGTG